MTLPNPSQATSVPAPASATPPETTPTQPVETQEKPADQPQYVTQEALDAAIEQAVRRATQSSKDRTQKVEAEVKTLAAKLEKAGATVTPEITQGLRQQVEAELDEQPAPPPAAPGPAPASATPGQGDPVYDWTIAAYQSEGITIKPEYPEFAIIKAALDDPAGNMPKYQKAVFKAIDAYRERTASLQSTADARTLGGGNQPPGQATYKNATEAWQEAYRPK